MATHYYSSHTRYLSPPPLKLCFFFLVLLLLLGFSWYVNYESKFEDLMDQLRLIVCPVLLLLVVHWLSSEEKQRVPFVIPLPEQDSIHRAGGSPWGVALVLLFLMFMISCQASIKEKWFPLLSR